jgi:hypothetical protein
MLDPMSRYESFISCVSVRGGIYSCASIIDRSRMHDNDISRFLHNTTHTHTSLFVQHISISTSIVGGTLSRFETTNMDTEVMVVKRGQTTVLMHAQRRHTHVSVR